MSKLRSDRVEQRRRVALSQVERRVVADAEALKHAKAKLLEVQEAGMAKPVIKVAKGVVIEQTTRHLRSQAERLTLYNRLKIKQEVKG